MNSSSCFEAPSALKTSGGYDRLSLDSWHKRFLVIVGCQEDKVQDWGFMQPEHLADDGPTGTGYKGTIKSP